MKSFVANFDFWGMTTSLLCAIHCALLPLLLSLGLLGSSFSWMNHPAFEIIVAILSFYFVYRSLFRGYSEGRVRRISLYTASAGLFMILSHHFFGSLATPIVVTGGLTIALTHFHNLLFPCPERILKKGKI